ERDRVVSCLHSELEEIRVRMGSIAKENVELKGQVKMLRQQMEEGRVCEEGRKVIGVSEKDREVKESDEMQREYRKLHLPTSTTSSRYGYPFSSLSGFTLSSPAKSNQSAHRMSFSSKDDRNKEIDVSSVGESEVMEGMLRVPAHTLRLSGMASGALFGNRESVTAHSSSPKK
ncbi:hypothetical protein ADUPG1_002485, partial [Aduncisulcus paluster]